MRQRETPESRAERRRAEVADLRASLVDLLDRLDYLEKTAPWRAPA